MKEFEPATPALYHPRQLRRPRALPPGGMIGVVSPSSPVNTEKLDAGIAVLEARGFRVVVAPHARDRHGHMAGLDQDRAADFADFYASPEIDVVWCARGGSSSCRLWSYLDWAALGALPAKMVIGYSDITSLHVPITQRMGVVSLHGPMVTELGVKTPPDVLDWELRLLQETDALGEVPGRAPDVLIPGIAEGQLCGGCLSLFIATVGTSYQIETAGKLLLIEDIGHSPWAVERDLLHLREAGLLDQVAGFIIGEATNADDRETLPMRQIWAEMLESLGKPTVLNFPFGHIIANYALPLGIRAKLDASTGALVLLEPACVPF